MRVISNNKEAVCLDCSLKINLKLPIINNFEFDSYIKTIKITLDRPLPNQENIILRLGLVSINPNYIEDVINGNYLLSGSFTRVTAGIYVPEVISSLGKLEINKNLSSDKLININFTISQVIPKTFPYTGGSLIEIKGTNFPSKTELNGKLASEIGLEVYIGDLPCQIQEYEYESIKCITPKKNINSIITVKLYNQILEENKTNLLFNYDSTIIYPSLVSVEPNNAAPGEKKFIYITFDTSILAYDKNQMFVELKNKANSKIIRLYVVGVNEDGKKLKAKFSGAPLGKYELSVKLNSNTNLNSVLDFSVHIKIYSVSPNEGSIEGGTLINIKGENFLSQKINQFVFIKNLVCNYINVTNSEINCLTSAAPTETQEISYKVVVDQLLQYESDCLDTKSNCIFKYSKVRTSIVNDIRLFDNTYNLNNLSIGSQFLVYGEKFFYPYFPFILEMDWGKLSVESSIIANENSLNLPIQSKLIVLTCKIIEIQNYEMSYLDFYDYYGYSILKNPRDNQGKFLISFIYKKPNLISFTPQNLIMKQGAMFELLFDDIKGFSVLNNFRNSTSSLKICEKLCNLYPISSENSNNVLFNDNNDNQNPTLINKNNILRCKFVNTYVNPFLNQNSFSNCTLSVVNYFNSIITNENITNISLLPDNKHLKIFNILIDGINYNNNLATIIEITKNLVNFQIEFKLLNDTIPKEYFNIKLILNDNLIFMTNDCKIIKKLSTRTTIIDKFLVCVYVIDSSKLVYGLYDVYFYLSNFGYIEIPGTYVFKPEIKNTAISFKILIPLQLNNNKIEIIKSSFYGGRKANIPILNLDINPNTKLRKILICGLPINIINFDKNLGLIFESLRILKSNLNFAKTIIENKPKDLTFDESINIKSTPDIKTSMQNLLDSNPITNFNNLEKIAINMNKKIPLDFKLFISYIVVSSTEAAAIYDLVGSAFEASDNEIDYITIMTFEKEFYTFNEKKITIDYSNSGKKFFRSFRLNLKSPLSTLSEIRFFGNIVYDNTTTENLDCQLSYSDDFNRVTPLPLYTLNYRTELTLEVSNINPNSIIGFGENLINIYLNSVSKILSDSPNINAYVYGMLLNKNLINIIYDPLTFYKINLNLTDYVPNMELFNINIPLKINIEEIGDLAFNDNNFEIFYRWSDIRTWGMDFIPGFKDSVYIKNLNVLFDIETADLNFVLIENGSLKFEDTRDYKIKANNILIRSGNFIIGTEKLPFKHKFELIFTSTKKDPTLPIFGNKVLAVMEGCLDIHGIKKEFTHTLLAKTANIDEDFLLVQDAVDWEEGDEIVIASSSSDPLEAERFMIKKIIHLNENSEENKNLILNPRSTFNSSNQQQLHVFRKAKIILNKKIAFKHYGELESYTRNDGKVYTINMRSEVGLLTRNIKIHGDASSLEELYGSHIMLTGKQDESSIGRIEYVEVYYSGQAFQMGRYPIHFHMIGSVSGSYVRGCAIHDTFNRALTIHGVHNFLVEKNVAFNNMGHAFFMEDAIETKNKVLNNLGILTKKSFSLLNSDTTPATFWITNPFNYYENNRAGGSQHYGFWMEFPLNPTGLSTKSKACPREYPLGSFKNNFSHSNQKYGLRIFPEFNPKNKPCASFSIENSVFPIEASIEKFTTWRNREKGVIAEAVGNVVFKDIISADNPLSGIEISNLIDFPNGRSVIKDSLVIGQSQNPIKIANGSFRTKGIVTPRADNFLVSNISFFNFNSTNMANFGSCSRCEIAEPSTDSCARQIDFEKIFFDNSEINKVIWNYPKKAIYRDLDGTLTGKSPSGWATPFYNHNNVKECEINEKFDNGLICNNNVQIRRIAFSEAKPDSLKQKKIKIWRYYNDEAKDNLLINKIISPETMNNFSAIDFKVNKDPTNGWAIPFVTNYDYAVSFDLGINFDALKITRSVFWNNKDSPINLVFNFTARRDDFDTIISNKTNKGIYVSNNTTNLFEKNIYSQKLLANEIKFGDRFLNKNKSLLMIHVNGKDFEKQYDYSTSPQLNANLNAIQCFNNNCSIPIIVPVPLEDRIRLWSDRASWPNNTIPKENENVEIKSGWNMLLDISPPQLNLITINGRLCFDDSKNNLELKANRIFINMGHLQIGNSTNPYINDAKITLTGKQIDPILSLDNNIKFTNNILLNLNKLEVIGKDRSPYTSKLRESVKAGSSEILVAPNLKWKQGDEIILGTTSHDYNQTEKLRIKDYNPSTGKIIIDSNISNEEKQIINEKIKFDHFGKEKETDIPESNLDRLNSFDERADVVMLSRNIKIGAERNGFWGANIYSSGLKVNINNTLTSFPGEFLIKNVEFVNCGQNSEFPAIILKNSEKKNFFKMNSLNYIKFAGIQISKIKNLEVEDISILNPLKYGIIIEDSENVIISNSIVFNLRLEESSKAGFIDKGAGYYICIEGSIGCTNVVVKNNKNSGSEFMGFAIKGFECDFDMINSFYNIATACRYGFIIDGAKQTSCMRA